MGSPIKTNLNLMRLRRGLTRCCRHSSVSQQVAHFNEEKAAGRIIGRSLHGDEGRRSGTHVEIAIAIVLSEINRRTGLQQNVEMDFRYELFGGTYRHVRVTRSAQTTLQL